MVRQPEMLQQLHNTRRSRATVAHDKVYALLGLLSPGDRTSVLVDYSESVSTLYTKVALGIIRRQESLKVLSGVLVDDNSTDGEQCQLPSWVPNWTAASLTTSLGLSNQLPGALRCGRAAGLLGTIRWNDEHSELLGDHSRHHHLPRPSLPF